MRINFLILLISLLGLTKLPIGIGLFFDLLIYSSLVWYQFCAKKMDIISGVLFLAYLIQFLLYFVAGVTDVLPYTGILIYTIFAVLYAVCGFVGLNPWSQFERVGGVFKLENLKATLTFSFVSGVCAYLSFSLAPDASYIYIPIVIFGSTNLMKNWIFSQIGVGGLIGYRFKHRGFEIRSIETTEQEQDYAKVMIKSFDEFIQRFSTLKKDRFPSREILSRQMVGSDLRSDLAPGYVLYHPSGDPVACFRIYFDPSRGVSGNLPSENLLKLNWTELRRQVGKLAEVDRIAIIEEFQTQAEVMECILRSIGDICMRRRISFIFCQAFEGAQKMYLKMGFRDLLPAQQKICGAEFGLPVRALYMNIAHKISQVFQQRVHQFNSHEMKFHMNTFREYCKDICENSALGEDLLGHQLILSQWIEVSHV